MLSPKVSTILASVVSIAKHMSILSHTGLCKVCIYHNSFMFIIIHVSLFLSLPTVQFQFTLVVLVPQARPSSFTPDPVHSLVGRAQPRTQAVCRRNEMNGLGTRLGENLGMRLSQTHFHKKGSACMVILAIDNRGGLLCISHVMSHRPTISWMTYSQIFP